MFNLKILFNILTSNYENIVVIASILVGFGTISKKIGKEIMAFGIFLLLSSTFLHATALIFYKSNPIIYMPSSLSLEMLAQLFCLTSGLVFIDIETLAILKKMAEKINIRLKNTSILILCILTLYNIIALTLTFQVPYYPDLYSIIIAIVLVGITYLVAPILAAAGKLKKKEKK